MKKFILLSLAFASSFAFGADKILECEAVAIKKNKVLFEINADVHDRRVKSQGTVISNHTGRKSSVTKLIINSNDLFEDNFSISISHKVGKKMIEKETLKNLSLKRNLKEYGILKDFGDYKLDVVCKKI